MSVCFEISYFLKNVIIWKNCLFVASVWEEILSLEFM